MKRILFACVLLLCSIQVFAQTQIWQSTETCYKTIGDESFTPWESQRIVVTVAIRTGIIHIYSNLPQIIKYGPLTKSDCQINNSECSVMSASGYDSLYNVVEIQWVYNSTDVFLSIIYPTYIVMYHVKYIRG